MVLAIEEYWETVQVHFYLVLEQDRTTLNHQNLGNRRVCSSVQVPWIDTRLLSLITDWTKIVVYRDPLQSHQSIVLQIACQLHRIFHESVTVSKANCISN